MHKAWHLDAPGYYLAFHMWLLLPGTLAAAALTIAAPGAGPSGASIAYLKANPAAMENRTFEIRGQVVDIRAASPMDHAGLYRLVDASDTAGVLVQTADLPLNGGVFRVQAKLGPAQPGGKLMQLVELRRTSTGGLPRIPLVALVVCILAVVVLSALFVQAARAQREYLLALPLWLLPYAAPSGKTDRTSGDSLPQLRYQPELETEDRRHHVRLRNRKRAMLTGVGASTALTGLSAWWVVSTRPPAPFFPTFIAIGGDNTVPPPAPVAEASADRSDSTTDQAPAVRIAPPPPAPPAAPPAVAVAKRVVRDTLVHRPGVVAPPPNLRVAQTPPKSSPPAGRQPPASRTATTPDQQASVPPPPAPPQHRHLRRHRRRWQCRRPRRRTTPSPTWLRRPRPCGAPRRGW